MRIGVNTRLLLAGKMDGIGWFTYETLRKIVCDHPEHDFYFFFDRKPAPSFRFTPNVHPVRLRPPARHPILWCLFFDVSMRIALRKYKIDFLFSPECYIPLRLKIPTLSVIHDLNYEHSKGNLKPSHQVYMDFFSHRFAKYSTRVATVSEYSKSDIVDTYHVSPEKIDVVYNGANEGYHPLMSVQKQLIRQRYCQGSEYFIFIGTILKRKNLATLLKAFDLFKETDTKGIKLVVAGNRVWWQDELAETYDNMQFQQDVIFLGRVSQDDLFNLLGASLAMVYPSLFEGFGIPIVEAFYAEVPVITSNCTSMPEVAGDAAILVDPLDVNNLADSMTWLATDVPFRDMLISKGREQRLRFTWTKTAERLWESMMNSIEQGGC